MTEPFFKYDILRQQVDKDVMPFTKMVAEKITSPYKQDCSIAVVGRKGSGKSMFSLYAANNIARYIAQKLDGDMDNSPDYFNMDTNLTILDDKGTNLLMRNLKMHNVYILDDVSISWGSREFMTRENKNLNKIFTAMRPKESCLIMNMPDQKQIDIVPRTLADFFVEMHKTYYSAGIALVKIYKQDRNFKMDKTFNRFLLWKKHRVSMWVSKLPPQEMQDKYHKLRNEMTDRLVSGETNPHNVEAGKSKRVLLADQYGERIRGMAPRMSIEEIANDLMISDQSVRKIIRKLQIPYSAKGRWDKKHD